MTIACATPEARKLFHEGTIALVKLHPVKMIRHGWGFVPSKNWTQLHLRVLSRFWRKVKVLDDDDCWEWEAGMFSDGYGTFSFQSYPIRSHRFSLFADLDIWVSSEVQVLHDCDNPKCVNPSHLFLGNSKINMQDRDRKGRKVSFSGEDNSLSKVTEQDVRKIRIRHSLGESCKKISNDFDLCAGAVWKIVTRKTWKHL